MSVDDTSKKLLAWRDAEDATEVYAQRYRAFTVSDYIEDNTLLVEEFEKVRTVLASVGDADAQLQVLATYLGLNIQPSLLHRRVPSRAKDHKDAEDELFRACVAEAEAFSDYEVAKVHGNWALYPFDVWRKYSSDNYQASSDGITVQNWLRAVFERMREGAKKNFKPRSLRNVVIYEVPYRTDTRAEKKRWLREVALAAGLDVADVVFRDEVDGKQQDDMRASKRRAAKNKRLFDRLFDELPATNTKK
jgi:hypothetical protein